ncbi:hypothetical protein ACJIZ3_001347 [Penstemon smallii]|uniref:Formin-like protein n=1 Tax=Penstemon smallii TaxID=265156 RepID=A0ABD3U3B3_9LAMI
MKMGHGSHVFLMISIFLISFYCTHILTANSSLIAQEYLTRNQEAIHNEKESKQGLEALILKKFRILLRLESYSTRKTRNGDDAYFSPSPSPSPLPCTGRGAPAHSPVHQHAHPPWHHHHHHLLPQAHKIHNNSKEARDKRVTAAVLASVGVTSLLCAIGLFFGCRKFNKQRWRRRRRTKTKVSIYRTEAGNNKGISKFLTSQSSVKKVSSDPGPDLFYLDSLETALEPEKCCLKLNYDTGDSCSKQSTSNATVIEREEPISGSGRCSSLGGITPVHEISEEVYTFVDKIIPSDEAHSSDDESFHSFCDSHSSELMLSNASAVSLSETSEIISEDVSNAAPSEISNSNPILSPPSSQLQPRSSPPPPPTLPTPSTTRILPNISSLKAPAGIPPPPCPPPLIKQHVNSPNAPPPPLQLPTQNIPLGKDGTPLPKLKPLHWDKVRAAPDRSTVWDKLRSSSFEFDEEMIESLFGYNLQNPTKSDEPKSKTPSPSKHVLEPKRLQNITILSKALSVTAEQICGALIQGDGLPLQDLEALSKMVPTKEEEAKLSYYKGNILELGSAEKLVKLMLKIPFAFARIEAMLYRETFDDEVFHLRKSFSMLEEACKELRSSRLFLKLLEAVLKTGNRMNVGTIRGEAKAFKLDALLKLADVKGTDGKTTLLHFVVQEIIRSEGIRVSESIMGKINLKSKNASIEDKEESYRRMGLDLVIGLSSELCNVKKTATIDLDVLASSVANLSGGINKLQYLVQKDMIMEEKKGNFVNSMRSFLKYAELKLKELQEDENIILLHVREITEYFHGNVSKDESNPLRIFVIVRDFLGMLDLVCKELKCLKTPRSPNPLAPFR